MQGRRFTPDELKSRLMEYYRSTPIPVSEKELSEQLDKTTVHRYTVGDKLLEEVQSTLRKIASDLPECSARNEAVLAIDKIDEAAKEIVFGAMAYNKGFAYAQPVLEVHHEVRQTSPRNTSEPQVSI